MRYVMSQKLLSFGDDFSIKDAEGREVLYVDGKVLSLGDKLIFKDRDGRVVAEVSKKWFSWTDSYGVDVAEGEDDVLILACAMVIDMACHKDEKGDH